MGDCERDHGSMTMVGDMAEECPYCIEIEEARKEGFTKATSTLRSMAESFESGARKLPKTLRDQITYLDGCAEVLRDAVKILEATP